MGQIKIKCVLFRSKTLANGAHPILFRLTDGKTLGYIASGYSAIDNNWDDENCRLVETRKRADGKKALANAFMINVDLTALEGKLFKARQELELQGGKYSIQDLRNLVEKKKTSKGDFIAYGRKLADRLLTSGKIRTYKRYTSVLNKLDVICPDGLLLEKLNYSFLKDHEASLLNENKHVNTVHNHQKTIRSIYYQAIKEGLIDQDKNPFFQFKLKTEKTQKEKLSADEIKTIEGLELPALSLLWHTRNYFLFSFYNAGIRFGDLATLKWENIKGERMVYQMGKTSHYKSIKLHPKAHNILSLYKPQKLQPSAYIFPLMTLKTDGDKLAFFNEMSAKNALINKYLKKLGKMAEIEKTITFHVSRHSFSDIARKKGMGLYDISKALGHSNTTITENYLSSFDEESLDKAMDKVFD